MKFITSWLGNSLRKFCKNSWLMCVCTSAFFVYSCREKGEPLGLGVLDSRDLLTANVIDTFTIDTKMILSNDEIVSKGASTMLIGAYVDNYFGNVQAGAYAQVRLNQEYPLFGAGSGCDSLIMYMDYSGYYYGDTSQTQTFEVYSLVEAISTEKNYTVNDVIPTDQLLGEVTLKTSPKKSNKLIKVVLDKSFGDQIISKGYNSNENFVKLINGLHIKPKNDNEGAVIGVNPLSASSGLVLYYHNNSSNGLVFPLNFGSNAIRFNTVSSDKTGTPLASLINEGDKVSSADVGNLCYTQASTGVRLLLSLPSLESFKDSIGAIAINRAEIYMNLSPGSSNGEHDEPARSILVYSYDSETIVGEKNDGTLDLIVTDYVFQNGFPKEILEHNYISSSQQYILFVTDWVKDYFLGKRDNTNIILSASGNGYTVDRLVVEDHNSSVPKKKMKMVLYYSKRN